MTDRERKDCGVVICHIPTWNAALDAVLEADWATAEEALQAIQALRKPLWSSMKPGDRPYVYLGTGCQAQIRPCPFCESTSIEYFGDGEDCWMVCADCKVSGPIVTERDIEPFRQKLAIELWNKRLDTPGASG